MRKENKGKRWREKGSSAKEETRQRKGS